MPMEVQQALGVHALSKRIQDEATILPNGLLKVADFLNCRVDPMLMDSCGVLLARRLIDFKPTKVLTGSSCQGLLPAVSTARHLGVPLVFAHASVPVAWGESVAHKASSGSQAHWVNEHVLCSADRVVIVDDIIRSGSTVMALKSICEQAGASLVGVGAIIDCRENGHANLECESLVRVSRTVEVQGSNGFEISPAVQRLTVPPYVAADALTKRILADGKVLPGNLLKVYNFVNHQVDTSLMDMCGQLLARVFGAFGVQKVLTAQTGGLPPAHAVASALQVPLVCARETQDGDESILSSTYSATSESFTKKRKLLLYVNKSDLNANERILVVDDFLATGTTAVALHRLVEQANSEVIGMAFLVEKRFQDGRGKILTDLPHLDGRVVSLACIEAMSAEGGIELNRDVVGDCEPKRATPKDAIITRVLECAKPVRNSCMLNASMFLNHMVDTTLMDHAALLLAPHFVHARPTAVLTAEASGVAPALRLAMELRVPLLCARKEVSPAMQASAMIVSVAVERSSNTSRGNLHIQKNHLRANDTVLIIDDILGNGATALALLDLCEQVGANVIGMAFLVEKTFGGGREKILAKRPQLVDDIVVLTSVTSMGDTQIKAFQRPEAPQRKWKRVAKDLVRRMGDEIEVDVASNVFKFKSILCFHMSMDPVLLDACGSVLAAQFDGITKVLTGAPIQGLAVAHAVARHLGVQLVFARTTVPLTMKDQQILTAKAPAGTMNVSAEFFGPEENILIVDDFLASGLTALALNQICEQAKSSVAGFGFLALNCTSLVGHRAVGHSATAGRDALGDAKVVVLAEVHGSLNGAPCEVRLPEWLQNIEDADQ